MMAERRVADRKAAGSCGSITQLVTRRCVLGSGATRKWTAVASVPFSKLLRTFNSKYKRLNVFFLLDQISKGGLNGLIILILSNDFQI